MIATDALERRLEWFKWAVTDGVEQFNDANGFKAIRNYIYSLRHGPTYFMNKHFCQLVDVARANIPDDLKFEAPWMITPAGWMWMETPFEVPKMLGHENESAGLRISAVSWFTVPSFTAQFIGLDKKGGDAKFQEDYNNVPAVYFLVYLDCRRIKHPRDGFVPYSYFVIPEGMPVFTRIKSFENAGVGSDGNYDVMSAGKYGESSVSDMLHEIRWIYAAMHLMSEKLTATREEKGDRAFRRRWERERERPPIEPLVKIVTLRRVEEARKLDPEGHRVEWNWSWHVTGHWRRQYYASTKEHKPKWIEEYVKGPTDKPLKPPVMTVYKAGR